MNPDEVVRKQQVRPGYRLADYAEVGLPVYRLSSRIFTLVQKRISSIDEFLLRLVGMGIHRTEEIAAFLGLPVPFVDESLSQLIADELLALTPTNSRTQRLSLSPKGRRALESADTLIPEERPHTIEFDALLQKVARHGRDLLLTGRQTRDRGFKQIRPLLKRPIGIADLSLRDVQNTFNRGAARRDGKRTVLAVCEIYKKSLYFLPAICIIYRATDSADIQVSFIIDGKHSPEHDQAFAQADGARMLHIDRDLAKFADTAEDLEAIEREVMQSLTHVATPTIPGSDRPEAKIHIRQVPGPQSWSFLTAEQQVEIKQSGLAYLDAHDHYPLLLNAVKTARFRLMILSPFLHERVLTDEFLLDLEKLLRRGCKVYLGYGMPDSDIQKPSKSHVQTLERLEKVTRRFGNLILSKIDSHAKVLLQDEVFVVLGSFNWLSFRGDPDRAFRDEQSVLVALPSMVERKFQSGLKLFT